jgi:hypothetical protein
MVHYLVAFGFFVVGFAFMALMLQFSKFKKTKAACCGDILESFEKTESCYTCPNHDEHHPEESKLLSVH